MTEFNISRLKTEHGIFRLFGYYEGTTNTQPKIVKVEMLGTDGWIALDMHKEVVIELVCKLMPSVCEHLIDN